MLTDEQRTYFDELEFMFGTAGWKHLTDEARRTIYQFQCDALEKAKSFEDVMFYRGQAEQLCRLLDLPDTTASLRSQLESD